jgi:lipocalin
MCFFKEKKKQEQVNGDNMIEKENDATRYCSSVSKPFYHLDYILPVLRMTH